VARNGQHGRENGGILYAPPTQLLFDHLSALWRVLVAFSGLKHA